MATLFLARINHPVVISRRTSAMQPFQKLVHNMQGKLILSIDLMRIIRRCLSATSNKARWLSTVNTQRLPHDGDGASRLTQIKHLAGLERGRSTEHVVFGPSDWHIAPSLAPSGRLVTLQQTGQTRPDPNLRHPKAVPSTQLVSPQKPF